MERAIGDYGIEKGLSFAKLRKLLDKKVAVIGAGPSGLSCAYHLARLGYNVTVFESANKAGGMLSSIPQYRLPDSIVDAEIKRILDIGIAIKLGVTVGKDITLDSIRKEFTAVYVALGAQGSAVLDIGNENDIYSGLAFLQSVKQGRPFVTGKNVIVIGGGNTAIDTARTARRLGSDVTILYRRTIAEMPAHKEEIAAAVQEGVKINFLCAPITKNDNGTLTCQKMELGPADASGRPQPVPIRGSEHTISFDTLIAAVGQDLQAQGFESLLGSSWIGADALGRTKEKELFAGGDAVTGPGLVAEAIGAGRKAALVWMPSSTAGKSNGRRRKQSTIPAYR